jgi:hypothetical protein
MHGVHGVHGLGKQPGERIRAKTLDVSARASGSDRIHWFDWSILREDGRGKGQRRCVEAHIIALRGWVEVEVMSMRMFCEVDPIQSDLLGPTFPWQAQ